MKFLNHSQSLSRGTAIRGENVTICFIFSGTYCYFYIRTVLFQVFLTACTQLERTFLFNSCNLHTKNLSLSPSVAPCICLSFRLSFTSSLSFSLFLPLSLPPIFSRRSIHRRTDPKIHL